MEWAKPAPDSGIGCFRAWVGEIPTSEHRNRGLRILSCPRDGPDQTRPVQTRTDQNRSDQTGPAAHLSTAYRPPGYSIYDKVPIAHPSDWPIQLQTRPRPASSNLRTGRTHPREMGGGNEHSLIVWPSSPDVSPPARIGFAGAASTRATPEPTGRPVSPSQHRAEADGRLPGKKDLESRRTRTHVRAPAVGGCA
ncbi:hypothetical protein JHW43_007018 [Diplocarpon mali]|nr:hypothetical protein JHW43_007018 [Diplocarpon mali]